MKTTKLGQELIKGLKEAIAFTKAELCRVSKTKVPKNSRKEPSKRKKRR